MLCKILNHGVSVFELWRRRRHAAVLIPCALLTALIALAFGAAEAVAGDNGENEAIVRHQSHAEDNRTERVAEQRAHADMSLVTGSIGKRPAPAKTAPVAKVRPAAKPAATVHSAKGLVQSKAVRPNQPTAEVQRIQKAAFANDKGQ